MRSATNRSFGWLGRVGGVALGAAALCVLSAAVLSDRTCSFDGRVGQSDDNWDGVTDRVVTVTGGDRGVFATDRDQDGVYEQIRLSDPASATFLELADMDGDGFPERLIDLRTGAVYDVRELVR